MRETDGSAAGTVVLRCRACGRTFRADVPRARECPRCQAIDRHELLEGRSTEQ